MRDYHSEMSQEEHAAWEELVDKIEAAATDWVNKTVPDMYKALEKAGITYNDEMLCHALSDGFKAGYTQALRDEDAERTKRLMK